MIAVVGVGAIGGLCAGHLLAGGADVLCCARRPFDALVVETGKGTLRSAPRVETDPACAPGPVAWVLFATKAHQTEGAARWLEALVGSGTRVAVLQNGVEHRERLAPWVEAQRVLPVVVACPASSDAPGRIAQSGPARLAVPDDADGAAFSRLFDGTAVEVARCADFASEAWQKLCLNVTSGPLAALAGVPLPEIRDPRRVPIARALALECARVARAEGAELPDDTALRIARRVATALRGGRPSTLQDRLRGRPLEADARNGAVVRFGARHGIPTPVNARALALMHEVHRDPRSDWLPRLAEALD